MPLQATCKNLYLKYNLSVEVCHFYHIYALLSREVNPDSLVKPNHRDLYRGRCTESKEMNTDWLVWLCQAIIPV